MLIDCYVGPIYVISFYKFYVSFLSLGVVDAVRLFTMNKLGF